MADRVSLRALAAVNEASSGGRVVGSRKKISSESGCSSVSLLGCMAMTPASEAAVQVFHEGRCFLSVSRWSPGAFVVLAIAACGNRAGGVAGSGSSSGAGGGVIVGGASTGASAGVTTGRGVGSGSMSGTGTGSTTGSNSGATEGGMGSGGSGWSGIGSTGMSGSSGTIVSRAPTFVNYELTGTWPTLIAGAAASPIKQQPGNLTYQMVWVQPDFLAESCAIGDYNADGIPDLSSGRRWYEGPDFTTVHIFRGGHDALPRTGAPSELQNGISDDWADYPWDVDGDGWTVRGHWLWARSGLRRRQQRREARPARALWRVAAAGDRLARWRHGGGVRGHELGPASFLLSPLRGQQHQ
jgi:hypothetical protein